MAVLDFETAVSESETAVSESETVRGFGIRKATKMDEYENDGKRSPKERRSKQACAKYWD